MDQIETRKKWYTFHDRFWYIFSRPLTIVK